MHVFLNTTNNIHLSTSLISITGFMKNFFFSLLSSLLCVALLLPSCKKELSFEEQLVGNWKSQKVKASGVDVSSSSSLKLVLQPDKKFKLDITGTAPLVGVTTQSFVGSWVRDPNDDNDILLTFDATGQTSHYEIDSLEENSMEAEILVSGVLYEVQFQRQ